MLLTLVIILVLIWSAVVGSIYSNFLVFYENFTETENYHRARYASTAAIERAELVIKQREPWYIWSWWWMLGDFLYTWDSPSDNLISNFSYLSNDVDTENKSTVFWKINSRTTRIPSTGNGNVDKLLATNDSPNYNMMDYENAEIFLLYYDTSEDEPYVKKNCLNNWDCNKSKPDKISGQIRLPQRIHDNFRDLDVRVSLFPEWWYRDDAIVDRQIRGNYLSSLKIPFTIFATQSAAWAQPTNKDSAIRESNLNAWTELEFWSDSWDPRKWPWRNNPPEPTIISQSNKDILDATNDYGKFREIFTNNYFSNLQLRLSLLNLALWEWFLSKRYPFLEYYMDFWDEIVSDKYFTIQTEWNYWDYKIDNIIFEPTITESILRSFTTIF